MHRFKNILCVVHPEESNSAVVHRASELASLHGTDLTLVHVFSENAADGTGRVLDSASEVRAALPSGSDNRMRRTTDKNVIVGDVESKSIYDIPSDDIVKQVISGNHDLLIKSVENTDNGSSRLNALDKRLLRECPCPVWFFKSGCSDKHERILAAVDSDLNSSNAELNNLVLDFSTSLATEEQAELHAVSSWAVPGEAAMRSRVGNVAIRRLVAGIRRSNMQWLRRITKPYARVGARFHVHLNKGKHNQAVMAEAKKRRLDLIVLGVGQRTGVSEFLFGTLAEQILSKANCSVLAVKPKTLASAIDA